MRSGGVISGGFGTVVGEDGADECGESLVAVVALGLPRAGENSPQSGTGAIVGGGMRFSVWQAASHISHTTPTVMFNQGLCLFARGLWFIAIELSGS